MKARLPLLFLSAFLLLGSLSAAGQGKVYSRKVRLGDFPTRTTKIVLAGSSILELALREEIAVHWRISPYEFCTQEEYARLRTSNNLYFLRLAQEDGIAFLILAKGGKDDEKESLRKPFEVVRMPIASSGAPSGRELVLMGAFLDIIQAFVEEAMISDRTAYLGLAAVNVAPLRGKRIILDPDEADRVYLAPEPDTLVAVTIAPEEIGFNSFCYKMLISADTHELYHYARARYKGPRDARFSEAEIQRFTRRGAAVGSGTLPE